MLTKKKKKKVKRISIPVFFLTLHQGAVAFCAIIKNERYKREKRFLGRVGGGGGEV